MVESVVTCVKEDDELEIVCPPPPISLPPTDELPPLFVMPFVVLSVTTESTSQVNVSISNSVIVGSFQFTVGTQASQSNSFDGLDLTQVVVIPSSLVDPELTSFTLDVSATGVVFAFSSTPAVGIPPGEDQVIITIEFAERAPPQEPVCITVG